MSCYTRHLGPLLEEAGLINDRETRRHADRAIRADLHVEGEDCPVVWRAVKACLVNQSERQKLVATLRRLHQRTLQ